MNQETKICQNCQKSFTVESEDSDFYAKIKAPPPTFCPECRLVRKLTFRNEKTLYKRKCDATNKEIFSIYRPGTSFTIYDREYWWSDKWNPFEYGREYNFSINFFEQFRELLEKVPRASLIQQNVVNSPYANYVFNIKNSYMVFGADTGENLLYCVGGIFNGCMDSVDLHQCAAVENSYFLVDCTNCNKVFFAKNCEDCIDSAFLYDCRNCSSCFGCVGLRNKSYYIFNTPYQKEEYIKEIARLDIGSFRKIQWYLRELNKLKLEIPHRFAHIIKSVDCSGDDISNSKNCKYCFLTAKESEDCKYGFRLSFVKDCMDGVIVWKPSGLCYELIASYGYNIFFSAWAWNGNNVYYSDQCFDCSNIFGCAGLRNASYCILNKQYSKEEYEKLVPKIIRHMNERPYISKFQIPSTKFQTNSNDQNSKSKTREIVYRYGEFFPPELSPFAYNETIAQEYFPLTKDQAIAQGYNWKDPEKRNYELSITNYELPDNIKDVSDSIIGKVIECQHKGQCNEQCTEAFRIIEPELAFYRKMNLPLPRTCPNCRHYARLKQRNPLKLWKRQCLCKGQAPTLTNNYANTCQHEHGDKPCPNTFETSYAPDRPEIVYCEQCYLREVV